MKSLGYLGFVLCLSLLVVGCDEPENKASNGSSSQPNTTVKESDRPEGLADKDGTKTLAPTDIEPPKNSTSAEPKSDDDKGSSPEDPLAVPPATPPAAVRSVPQNVPDVDPLAVNVPGSNGTAIATKYSTPDISEQIIPYLISNKNQIGACQDIRYEPDFTATSSQAYRIDENRYLAHFVCGSTAYQVLQEYYLYEQTTDAPLITILPVTYFYSDLKGNLIEESERAIAGYSDYNPNDGTISIFTKGRGLGDCGTLGFYRLDGSQLKVDRFLAKTECDGNYIEPINYPQVYPES